MQAAAAPPVLASTKPRVDAALCDHAKWLEFVNGTKLKGVAVHDYYLGKRPVDNYSNDEHARVAIELFADAVGVGAIVLPGSYAVDDFELALSNNLFNICLRSKLHSREAQRLRTGYSPQDFHNMNSKNTFEFLDRLAYRVDLLTAKAGSL
jgi:hypothetical protein